MSANRTLPGAILRTLGLPACCTLEYYWEDMHFLPGEIIPHSFLESDYGMQEALLRLHNRTGLAQKTKKGWKISRDVYDAVLGMTAEDEKTLYRSEMIRQVICGALERLGMASMAQIGDCFRTLNTPEDVWQAAYADLFERDYYEVYDEGTDTRYVAHTALEDAGELLAARHEAGVFAASAEPLMLRLSDGWLPGDADIYFSALEWLNRQEISPEDAATLVQNAFYALQDSGEADDMAAEIAEALGMDALPADAEAIFAQLADRVPRWALEGISMHEFRLMQHPDESGNSPF